MQIFRRSICPALAHESSRLHQIGELAFRGPLRYLWAMDAIEDLARKLADSVPESLRSVRDDLEDGFRSVLKTGIEKLDLVTREEFEVQEAVLARTREKLEQLEQRLAEYEKQL